MGTIKMKPIKIAIIFIVYIQLPLQAQFFKGTIIKTKPFQDFIAFNPNLEFEKPVHKIISVETELMYRNRNWNSSGGEGDFGHYYNGDGYRILVGSKVYFGQYSINQSREGLKAPFGWFAAMKLSYNYALTYDIEKRASISRGYLYTVDSKEDWFEINIIIGKQLYLFKAISFEFNLGSTLITAHTEEMTIVESENTSEIGNSELEQYSDTSIQPYASFTIGYFIK
jgi:hypothetical protein